MSRCTHATLIYYSLVSVKCREVEQLTTNLTERLLSLHYLIIFILMLFKKDSSFFIVLSGGKSQRFHRFDKYIIFLKFASYIYPPTNVVDF